MTLKNPLIWTATTTGDIGDVESTVYWEKIKEEIMDYEDYVGIAHQIMAMEYGWA